MYYCIITNILWRLFPGVRGQVRLFLTVSVTKKKKPASLHWMDLDTSWGEWLHLWLASKLRLWSFLSVILTSHFLSYCLLLLLLVFLLFSSFSSSRDGTQSKLLKFSLGHKKTSRSASYSFFFLIFFFFVFVFCCPSPVPPIPSPYLRLLDCTASCQPSSLLLNSGWCAGCLPSAVG